MRSSNAWVLSCLVLYAALLGGCSRGLGPSPGDSGLPAKDVTGSVAMAPGCPLEHSELEVITLKGAYPVGTTWGFSAQAVSGCYAMTFVVDGDENIVAATFDTLPPGVVINARSTAKAIVALFPVEWGLFGLQPHQLLQEIEGAPSFGTLLEYVEQVMANDPIGLLDYEAHPALLQSAAHVVREIQGRYGPPAIGGRGGAYVTDVPASRLVRVRNPEYVPYGISGYNVGGAPTAPSTYFLTGTKAPMWTDGLSLIDVLWGFFGGAGEDVRDYDLGDGTFVLMLSKMDPWDFARTLRAWNTTGTLRQLADYIFASHAGDQAAIVRGDARLKGYVGGMGYLSVRAIGLVPGGGDVAALVIDFAMEAANNATITSAVGVNSAILEKASSAGTMVAVLGIALDMIEHNADAVARHVLGDAALARGLRTGCNALGRVLMVPDIWDLCMFLYDLGTADQDIAYTVSQTGGNAQLTRSLPPSIPSISTPSLAYEDQPQPVTVVASDPDGDDLCYEIVYGDGTSQRSPALGSGQPHTFTHSWERGVYVLSARAVDSHGAASSWREGTVHVVPPGGFWETFDTYVPGGIPSELIWYTEYMEPSRVMITSAVAYGGTGNSCKFIDYDPDIGDEEGYYAMILTQIVGHPTTVQFAVRVSDQDDAFGVRAWGSLGYWNTLSYYVLTLDGSLCWVRYGHNPSDPNDFVPFRAIVPGTWYVVRLAVDWGARTYSIYVDGQLVVTNATFIGSVTTAPAWQAVAFSDDTCGAAYLDAISMEGASCRTPLGEMPLSAGAAAAAISRSSAGRP